MIKFFIWINLRFGFRKIVNGTSNGADIHLESKIQGRLASGLE